MAVLFVHEPRRDRRTAYCDDGTPGWVALATLAGLAVFDDEAVASAVASGFATLEDNGRKLRIPPAGRSIFEAAEVRSDASGDLLAAVGWWRSLAVSVEALASRLGIAPGATWEALGAIEMDGTPQR